MSISLSVLNIILKGHKVRACYGTFHDSFASQFWFLRVCVNVYKNVNRVTTRIQLLGEVVGCCAPTPRVCRGWGYFPVRMRLLGSSVGAGSIQAVYRKAMYSEDHTDVFLSLCSVEIEYFIALLSMSPPLPQLAAVKPEPVHLCACACVYGTYTYTTSIHTNRHIYIYICVYVLFIYRFI